MNEHTICCVGGAKCIPQKYYYRSNGYDVDGVDQTTFLQAKFGGNFAHIMSHLKDDTAISRRIADGHTVCCGFRDSRFHWFNEDGERTKILGDIGTNSIYGFDFDMDGNIWYVIPTEHYVGCYSPALSQEIFHLGGVEHEGRPLSYPEDIVLYGRHLYVSDMGHQRICTVNTETKEFSRS